MSVLVSLLNSTEAEFATATGAVTFELSPLPPVIELTRKGAFWLVAANTTLLVDGRGRLTPRYAVTRFS